MVQLALECFSLVRHKYNERVLEWAGFCLHFVQPYWYYRSSYWYGIPSESGEGVTASTTKNEWSSSLRSVEGLDTLVSFHSFLCSYHTVFYERPLQL